MPGISAGLGGQVNNNIQTDGLIFYVDSAYKKSYLGSGTTWNDLGGSNNGTLYAIDIFGNIQTGFPINGFGSIVQSIIFEDLNNDNLTEIIFCNRSIKSNFHFDEN